MLANNDIMALATQTSPEGLSEEVRMLVTKLIDAFMIKFRMYVTDRLTLAFPG